MKLEHRFVEFIPTKLEAGVLYVSIPYRTALHACACGCGNEVVTPLSPADWTLTYDGEAVSLDPSIGNWSFPCKSHYWIRHNKVVWAHTWTPRRIQSARKRETTERRRFYERREGDED
jgi:hypothetical protein